MTLGSITVSLILYRPTYFAHVAEGRHLTVAAEPSDSCPSAQSGGKTTGSITGSLTLHTSPHFAHIAEGWHHSSPAEASDDCVSALARGQTTGDRLNQLL